MRPLLVGLNNPHSVRESDALLHYPRGATGWRILEMIRLADPAFTADDYLEAFDRRNLWPGCELPDGRGRAKYFQSHGRALLRELDGTGRDVVLFGKIVWASVLDRNAPPKFTSQEKLGCTFWYLPHPSGLCRDYNAEENRLRAGQILRGLTRAAEAERPRLRRASR